MRIIAKTLCALVMCFSASVLAEDQVFFFANMQSNQPVAAVIECTVPGEAQGFQVRVINSKLVAQPEYKLYFGVGGKNAIGTRWAPIESYSDNVQDFMKAMVMNSDLFIDRNGRDSGMCFGIGRDAEEAKQYSLNMKSRPILGDFKKAITRSNCRQR